MTRVPSDRFTYPWGDATHCPCGSGGRFAECCKTGPNQLPYVKIPSLRPPGPITNYAHPKCYLSPTNDCSKERSREHYISEAILQRFDRLRVSGMPWQRKGEKVDYPANALVANVLCRQHNSALAPIDTFGLKAFNALVEASDYAVTGRHPGRVQHHLISGDGLELWLFKLLAGMHFGGIAAADRGILRDTCSFPLDELVDALTTGILPAGSGFWVTQGVGAIQPRQISVAPMIEGKSNRNVGVQVIFGPLQFEATLIAPVLSPARRAGLSVRHRPRVIDYIGPARDARVVLSWPDWTKEMRRIALEVVP